MFKSHRTIFFVTFNNSRHSYVKIYTCSHALNNIDRMNNRVRWILRCRIYNIHVTYIMYSAFINAIKRFRPLTNFYFDRSLSMDHEKCFLFFCRASSFRFVSFSSLIFDMFYEKTKEMEQWSGLGMNWNKRNDYKILFFYSFLIWISIFA